MSEYTMGGAVLGALLVAVFGALYLLSQGWYYDDTTGEFLGFMRYIPLFLYMSSMVIGLLLGACVGALIGKYRHHLWQTWLRLDATLIDWLQKRGRN